MLGGAVQVIQEIVSYVPVWQDVKWLFGRMRGNLSVSFLQENFDGPCQRRMAGIIDLAIVSALFKQEFFKINKIAGRDFRDRKQIRLFGYRDIDIGGYAEGLVEIGRASCRARVCQSV